MHLLHVTVSNINLRIIFKPHANLQIMVRTSVQFEKNQNKTEGGVCTQGTQYTFTFIVKMPEKRLSSNCEKVSKINLRIISKAHAYLQSIIKTSVKFQKNLN